MKATFACAVVGAFLLPSSVLAGGARSLRWEELDKVVRKTVRIDLPDLCRVSGKVVALTAQTLVLDVAKTSDPKAHPRGELRIRRADVRSLDLSTPRHGGRIAGTVIGLAVGLAIDGAVGYAAIGRWNPSYTELGGILAVTTTVPPALGYYYGRRADDDWTTITIVP